MQINLEKLPYRNNVAAIVYKDNKFLLLQQTDWPDEFWKFPQGGVNEDETDDVAICRELNEEIGNNKFIIKQKSTRTNKYDWPDNVIEKTNYKWRGQFQKFFIVEFTGSDSDIKIQEDEIKKHRWITKEELKKYIDHDHKLFVNYYNIIISIIDDFFTKDN